MAGDEKEIISQDLEDIFDLETELFPCLVDMRFKGVRVDVEKAHEMKTEFKKQNKDYLDQLKEKQILIHRYGLQDLSLKYLTNLVYRTREL